MHAVRKLARAVGELLERNGLSVDQIGLFLFHQANLRLLERLMQELRSTLVSVLLTLTNTAILPQRLG